jgi:hypothetical protein
MMNMLLSKRLTSIAAVAVILVTVLMTTPSMADPAPARFTGFWRNFFTAKGSWPTAAVQQAQLGLAMGIMRVNAAMMIPVPGVATGFALLVAGQLTSDYITTITGIKYMNNLPEAPVILSATRDGTGVKISFRHSSGEYDGGVIYYTIFYFTSVNAAPRMAKVETLHTYGGIVELSMTDPDPPSSGTGFYAMTATRKDVTWTYDEDIDYSKLKPWWIYSEGNLPGNPTYYQSRYNAGRTSDYSAPFLYVAGAAPDLGSIDAVAVSPTTGDVYLSKPATTQIMRMTSTQGTLGEPTEFVNTGFKAPGQKGLAVDSWGNLYSDNSASDSQFGGRLFRFAPGGSRDFTGTVNYFSQLLMYANPASVGPMCIGLNGDLLVSESLSRRILAVPVSATYDPYRRVGQPFFTLPDSVPGPVIDLEVQAASGYLYVLDGTAVTVAPYNPGTNAVGSATGLPLESIPLE